MVRLKDVFWKYIDKDWDNDFFYHYLVDLLNYKKIIHSLDVKAESGQKRIGKGNPVRCMSIKMKQFEDDEPPEEILEYEREEDIV